MANLNLNRTQLGRWCSLDMRVSLILGEPMTPIFNLIMKNAVLRVKTCISVVCSSFRNYFQKLEHKVSTRSNGKVLKIPKVKCGFARPGFFFMGTRVFNSLPMEVCASLANDFRNKVKTHFLRQMIDLTRLQHSVF